MNSSSSAAAAVALDPLVPFIASPTTSHFAEDPASRNWSPLLEDMTQQPQSQSPSQHQQQLQQVSNRSASFSRRHQHHQRQYHYPSPTSSNNHPYSVASAASVSLGRNSQPSPPVFQPSPAAAGLGGAAGAPSSSSGSSSLGHTHFYPTYFSGTSSPNNTSGVLPSSVSFPAMAAQLQQALGNAGAAHVIAAVAASPALRHLQASSTTSGSFPNQAQQQQSQQQHGGNRQQQQQQGATSTVASAGPSFRLVPHGSNSSSPPSIASTANTNPRVPVPPLSPGSGCTPSQRIEHFLSEFLSKDDLRTLHSKVSFATSPFQEITQAASAIIVTAFASPASGRSHFHHSTMTMIMNRSASLDNSSAGTPSLSQPQPQQQHQVPQQQQQQQQLQSRDVSGSPLPFSQTDSLASQGGFDSASPLLFTGDDVRNLVAKVLSGVFLPQPVLQQQPSTPRPTAGSFRSLPPSLHSMQQAAGSPLRTVTATFAAFSSADDATTSSSGPDLTSPHGGHLLSKELNALDRQQRAEDDERARKQAGMVQQLNKKKKRNNSSESDSDTSAESATVPHSPLVAPTAEFPFGTPVSSAIVTASTTGVYSRIHDRRMSGAAVPASPLPYSLVPATSFRKTVHTRTASIGNVDTGIDLSRQVNQYIFLYKIGAGAQGTVHLALDTTTNEVRAVKEIPKSSVIAGSIRSKVQARRENRRLRNEIGIMQRCSRHPNLVTLYEWIDAEESVFLVMKFAEHGAVQTLDFMAQAAPAISVERSVRFASQLASALEFLHARHIAHRDICPSNVLLGADDVVYLSDFGVGFQRDRINHSGGGIHSNFGSGGGSGIVTASAAPSRAPSHNSGSMKRMNNNNNNNNNTENDLSRRTSNNTASDVPSAPAAVSKDNNNNNNNNNNKNNTPPSPHAYGLDSSLAALTAASMRMPDKFFGGGTVLFRAPEMFASSTGSPNIGPCTPAGSNLPHQAQRRQQWSPGSGGDDDDDQRGMNQRKMTMNPDDSIDSLQQRKNTKATHRRGGKAGGGGVVAGNARQAPLQNNNNSNNNVMNNNNINIDPADDDEVARWQKSDVWALGCVIGCFIYGRLLSVSDVMGKANVELLDEVCSPTPVDVPPRCALNNALVPMPVRVALSRMLDKNPKTRCTAQQSNALWRAVMDDMQTAEWEEASRKDSQKSMEEEEEEEYDDDDDTEDENDDRGEEEIDSVAGIGRKSNSNLSSQKRADSRCDSLANSLGHYPFALPLHQQQPYQIAQHVAMAAALAATAPREDTQNTPMLTTAESTISGTNSIHTFPPGGGGHQLYQHLFRTTNAFGSTVSTPASSVSPAEGPIRRRSSTVSSSSQQSSAAGAAREPNIVQPPEAWVPDRRSTVRPREAGLVTPDEESVALQARRSSTASPGAGVGTGLAGSTYASLRRLSGTATPGSTTSSVNAYSGNAAAFNNNNNNGLDASHRMNSRAATMINLLDQAAAALSEAQQQEQQDDDDDDDADDMDGVRADRGQHRGANTQQQQQQQQVHSPLSPQQQKKRPSTDDDAILVDSPSLDVPPVSGSSASHSPFSPPKRGLSDVTTAQASPMSRSERSSGSHDNSNESNNRDFVAAPAPPLPHVPPISGVAVHRGASPRELRMLSNYVLTNSVAEQSRNAPPSCFRDDEEEEEL